MELTEILQKGMAAIFVTSVWMDCIQFLHFMIFKTTSENIKALEKVKIEEGLTSYYRAKIFAGIVSLLICFFVGWAALWVGLKVWS